jgi:hypothetical protein
MVPRKRVEKGTPCVSAGLRPGGKSATVPATVSGNAPPGILRGAPLGLGPGIVAQAVPGAG